MKHFTDMVESLLSKTSDKVKNTAQNLKTQELMSKLTMWVSILWKNTFSESDKTDVLGREIKYGDVVAVIDQDNWDSSFGLIIDEPNAKGICRVFQMGVEEWEKEDPFYDCIYATPHRGKILVLARKEDGEKMIRLLLNVKKK